MTGTNNNHMTTTQFCNWLKFFRGASVTIGKGKTVWTVKGGYMKAGVPVVRLHRWHRYTYGKTQKTTTVTANRVYLAN